MTDTDLDLLIRRAKILDVIRLRVFKGWIAIKDGRFIYVEPGNLLRAYPRVKL